MKDFKYCLWLSPNSEHPWYINTNGFIPHLSIKTNLTYQNALLLFSKINNYNIDIELDSIHNTEENEFHSLYYTVKVINDNDIPEWWPKNAHISFFYKYNKKIKNQEIDYILNNLNTTKAKLNKLHLVKCSGHFKDWTILLTK